MAEVDLIIVAGGTNALGDGLTATDVPRMYQTGSSNVKIWNGAAFETMVAGTNTGAASSTSAWGPEVSFAKDWVRDNPSDTLYIVKYTKSDALLQEGEADSWYAADASELFSLATTEITQAKAAIAGLGDTAKVRAVLWMQGEADAEEEAFAEAYSLNLEALIAATRTSWGDYATRFYLGRINRVAAYPYATDVRSAQNTLSTFIDGCGVIDTDTYQLQVDRERFGQGGQIRFGHELYSLYKLNLESTRSTLAADGPSAYLGLADIQATDTDKAAKFNLQAAIIEEACNTILTLNAVGGDVVCTASEFRTHFLLKVTGHPAARSLIIPGNDRVFSVSNDGDGDLTVEISGGLDSVTLDPGVNAIIAQVSSTLEVLTEFSPESYSRLDEHTDSIVTYAGNNGLALRVKADETGLELLATGAEEPDAWETDTEYDATSPTNVNGGVIPFTRKRINNARLAQRQWLDRPSMEFEKQIARMGISGFQAQRTDSFANFVNRVGFHDNWQAAGSATSNNNNSEGAATYTNYFTSVHKASIRASGNNTASSFRSSSQLVAIGTAPNIGGFEFFCRFGLISGPTNTRAFVGLHTNGTDYSGASTSLSTGLSGGLIGVIKDQSDSTWKLIQRDTPTLLVTKTDSGFPANTFGTDLYEFRMFCEPGGLIYYRLERMNTGAVFAGNFTAGQLPLATEGLYPRIDISLGTGSPSAAVIGFTGLWVTSPY